MNLPNNYLQSLKVKIKKGFTLIELLVSVSIFIIMTTLLVAKYGNFNENVLLTNLAYDVAITLRTAQTYGLSVRTTDTATFTNAYGVNFDSININNSKVIFFVDSTVNSKFDSSQGETIDTYAIKRGAIISDVCEIDQYKVCESNGNQFKVLNVTYKRPDPNAQICLSINSNSTTGDKCGVKYAKITLKGRDGGLRYITVRENGQISVID